MKRIAFLVLALLLAAVCAAAEEETLTYTSGDFQYILAEDGTARVTRYTGADETLTVPGELDGISVTGIGDHAFGSCDSLTAVTISEGVTSIGAQAFRGCLGLTEITIPDGVTGIGSFAFYGCVSLTEVTLPDSVISVGANPFRGCEQLSAIHVSEEHPTLAVADGVLLSLADERLVWYPMGDPRESYEIPEGIRIIGDSALYGCNSLTEITIPDSVTSIGVNPFRNCEMLSAVHVSVDHPALATVGGVLFSKADRRLVWYPVNDAHTAYAIPKGIRVIGDYAFRGCGSLTEIEIPDSVTGIGNYAFSECRSLTAATIPDGVTSIGNAAFWSCSSLTGVTIPSSVTSIGEDAFAGCPSTLIITAPRGSYAIEYAEVNSLSFTYADSLDWLLD